MFLKNWYKALTAELYNSDSVTGKSVYGTDTRFTKSTASAGIYGLTSLTMAGSNSCISNNNTVPYMGIVKTNYTNGVIFGTGDTAPNTDDYILSGSIITTINGSGSVTVTADDNGCTFTGVYMLTNIGSEDITVKEMGLVMSGAYSSYFLIERSVLDEPITISAGEIGQVTYTIRFNYPTV